MASVATAVPAKDGKPPSEIRPDEKVELLSVKDIDIDWTWNARSGKWWDESDPDEPPPEPAAGTEEDGKKKKPSTKVHERAVFPLFMKSILESGTNSEPVLCRQPLKPGGKVRLVCGFRRARAVLTLAEKAKFQGPTEAQRGLLRCVVRSMTDAQARVANVRENTARDDLSGPDLCHAVGCFVVEDGLNDTQISRALSKSQPYVSKLHRIFKSLAPDVLAKWRSNAVGGVTLDDIERQVIMIKKDVDARPAPAEQMEFFDRVVASKGGKGAATRGRDAWIETKETEAEALGRILGLLSEAGCITVTEKNPTIVCFTVVELPKKRLKEMKPNRRATVERDVLAAFTRGVNKGIAEEADKPEPGKEDVDEDDSVDE